ncbi:hypothetical protein J4573_14685 [Actinomadura barringtoniae]|uniref:Uncharacterized protein n=1 Tax=Actinomadura barringtoniae TaxID=1427535 RepID=A0A939PEQ9_9ACTN|nr:hypothetical protein [Actinomadura barringtoniae]MBO2448349.1 hypothetical protein [Actinomadura barringtoniae]
MPTIKRTAEGDGGYFDPHTHFSGIPHYRVLGRLTPDGDLLIQQWRTKPLAGELNGASNEVIEDFLARHVIPPVTGTVPVHVKPPHKQDGEREKRLAGILYDLETRLLLMQVLGLGWGLGGLSAGDETRLAENAGTLIKIIRTGCDAVAAAVPEGEVRAELKELAKETSRKRPEQAAVERLAAAVLTVPIEQTEVAYEGLPKVVRHVCQNALTATPQNDYDSAYVGRGLLPIAIPALLGAGMRELRRQNIQFSEQSVPVWSMTGKWRENEAAATAVEQAEQQGVVVRWLPMLAGAFLGWVGDSHEYREDPSWSMLRLRDAAREKEVRPAGASGAALECLSTHLAGPYDDWTRRWAEFAPMPWPKRTKPTMHEEIAGWIDQMEAAVRYQVRYTTGFDIASPERTWYTRHGALLFERVLRMLFKVAREQRRPLVAHVHVGEGYPGFVDTDATDVRAAMKRKDQPGLRILYDPDTKLPAHYLCGENNVQQILNAVQRFRSALAKEEGGRALTDFDRYVRVRFGHVTHASLLQAQQMADAGIWADVNLSSNLATGALAFVQETEALSAQTGNVAGIIKQAATVVAQQPNAPLFKQHALVTLLTCGVPTVLGTDGGGIEHSEMSREYALAGAILANAAAEVDTGSFTILSSAKRPMLLKLDKVTKEALHRRLDVARLYEYQNAHHAWTESWERVPAPPTLPGIRDAELDKTLHGVFLDAVAGT